MRSNKAFTLIEVMVVLSILALIAILAYNFFGGTMKEAKLKRDATVIYEGLRAVTDASELYYIKNSAWPANLNDLVSGGFLKSVPPLVDSSIDSWPVIQTASDWGGPTNAADIGIYYYRGLPSGGDLTCRKFNEMFTSLGGGVPPTTAAPDRTHSVYCGDDGGDVWFMTIFEPK